ncbi:MAG: TVP38/TMEM64 family protein [Methanomicrobiaceae archaeon]|nr:TVP38/TMEM64 family protein [Methanomicrobiaceae archaeon]
MKEHFSIRQKIVLAIWITVVILILSVYYLDPGLFDLSRLGDFAKNFYIPALLAYFILLSLRGLTLLPSTPVLIAGILIFEPVTVFFVNIAGFLVSATLVYRYSGYLRLGEYFEKKYPKEIAWIRNLFRKREIPVIAGWSVCPFTHTDLIIYVSASLKIKLRKCLAGVLIGESFINAFYIFSITIILGI